MFIFSSFRRQARLAAFFVAVIAFVVVGGATRSTAAHAQPVDYGQDIQGQVIAGSQLRVLILDWQDKKPWTGSIDGPSGSIPWDAPSALGSDMSQVNFLTGLEAGTYTIHPGAPIAAGWHVAGYYSYPNAGTGGCPQKPASAFTQNGSVTFSDQHPVWGICIAVERDGAGFGSSLNVTYVTDAPAGPWAGGVNGPNSIYYALGDVVWSYSGTIHNLVPGTWNVYPTNKPTPGYTVAGYYKFESNDPHPNCPSNPASYSGKDGTVSVSQSHSNWVVCIRLVPAVPNSELWITMVTDGWPIKWDGTVTGPGTYSASFESIALGAAAHTSTLFNLAYGSWSVSAKNLPAPGYTLKGYALLDVGGFGSCPSDPGSYGQAHSFQINDQHPVRQVCILVDHPPIIPKSSLTLGILSTGAGSNTWDGIVTGPGGYATPWNQLQIGGPNYMGGQYNVFAGTYSVVAGKPVRPGWVVTGYASYETTQFLQMCPLDPAAYKPSPTPVTFSDQHPSWGICLKVELAPVKPTPTPFVPPAVEDVPPFEFPEVGFPGGTVVPTATATPSVPTPAATATPTVTKPIQTQVAANPGQTSEGPGAEAGGKRDTQPTSQDAPLPPNTGTGTATGGHGATFLALGALLLALSGLIVAANRLPGRPKR